MATRKKAPKRSKSATKRKATTKAKKANSATAKSKAKTGSKAKTKSTAKKTKAKSTKRKTASKPTAAKKKTAKSTAKKRSTKKAGAKSKKTGSKKAASKKLALTKSTGSNSSVVAKKRLGRVVKKTRRNSVTKPAAAPPPPEEKPLPKTRLNDKQLAEFKQRLLEKRRMLTGDVRNLTMDALGRDGSGELSNMPIHMADIGSDNWEQEFTLGLIENEQQVVREIDNALARIADRTYGVCVATGKHIGIARLRAKPWAKYCIEYARQQEIGRR